MDAENAALIYSLIIDKEARRILFTKMMFSDNFLDLRKR
jgi:hypothetical protein